VGCDCVLIVAGGRYVAGGLSPRYCFHGGKDLSTPVFTSRERSRGANIFVALLVVYSGSGFDSTESGQGVSCNVGATSWIRRLQLCLSWKWQVTLLYRVRFSGRVDPSRIYAIQ